MRGSVTGFDLTNLWALDEDIAGGMSIIVRLVARANSYADTLGYRSQFEAIVRKWRPELLNESH